MVTACHVTMLVASEMLLGRIWHLNFAEKEKKDISILTETRINHNQIHHVRNNWLCLIFFSPGDIHTKGLLVSASSGS